MKFTRINRLDFIARSHQLAQAGFVEYFDGPESTRSHRLITIWSAPNYSYTVSHKRLFSHIGLLQFMPDLQGRSEMDIANSPRVVSASSRLRGDRI
jgi:hypothetical protein